MNIRKILAVLVAAAMCFSFCMAAYAVNGAQKAPEENVTNESTTAEETTAEESTSEEVSEEPSSEEASSEENSTEQDVSEESSEAPDEDASEESSSSEESSEAPDEDDVIALIINLLGKLNIEEIKDAINDINEALGLPKIETFTDIPAYADALYEKLEDMGLGYADIINGITSSDLLDWLNSLLFGGGSSSKPVTTAPSGSNNGSDGEKDEDSIIPDTGATLGAAAAAVAVLGGSGGLALFLRKRDNDE